MPRKKLQATPPAADYQLPTGLLISFDGTDSSGKATQSRNLEKRLRTLGYIVGHFETPDYNTSTGKQLKQLFQGKIGPFSWQEKMKLLAANRAEHKAEVEEIIEGGGVVIYDRYVPSSLTFVTIEALTESEVNQKRSEIQAAVAKEEYEINGMPHEHLSIFLDVPPRLAASLLAERQVQNKDQAEYTDELSLQDRLYQEYQILCEQEPSHFAKINCLNEQGNIKDVDDISATVWQTISQKFPHLEADRAK